MDRRGSISRLDLAAMEERVRFDRVPLPDLRADGALRVEAGAAESYEKGRRAFQAQIRAEIARTGSGRVLVYSSRRQKRF